MQSNAFRFLPDERPPVPAFNTARSLLPQPVLPQYPDWAAAYWVAWEKVWSGLGRAPAGSPLQHTVLASNADGFLYLDETAVVARLAGYARPAYDLIHLLDTFLSVQQDDGFIPRELDLRSGKSCYLPFDPNSTGPNVLAWTEWRHFRLTGDAARLRDVFQPLAAYHRWLRLHRTWQSGLYWTTGYASGDTAQTAVPEGAFHHRHWAWLEATLQANVSGMLLGAMAELLEEPASAEDFSAERSALGRRINTTMWNTDTEFYHDTGPDGAFSKMRTMAACWALLDRQLVPEERRRILVQTLRDEHNARLRDGDSAAIDPVESLADDGDPPIGPIARTPLSTYVALRGLQTAGSWSLAHVMAVDELSAGTIAHDGSPAAAALQILVLLEQVIGLSIDWPLHQVTWRNYLGHEAETGVRGVALGDEGTADLLAADGVLTVRTDAPFTLGYRDREQEFQSAVPAGISTFELR